MTDEAPDPNRHARLYVRAHAWRDQGLAGSALVTALVEALVIETSERDVCEASWRSALRTIDRMQASSEAAEADADAWKEAALADVQKHAKEQARASIERLHAIEVKPGDVIVAKVPRDTNAAARTRILTHLQVAFPGHSVITTLADLGVYRPVTGA